MKTTVFEALLCRLRESLAFNPDAQEGPVALLWPDEGEQWKRVVDRIGEHLPLISLGDFDPAARRGPSYWLRCVVAGTIDGQLPEGKPIVYLPGVARTALRAVESCPSRVAPIAELQYRSQWFSHPNNRDWTVRALLAHQERGLGLNIDDDGATTSALQLALVQLLDERVDRLERLTIDADFLLELVNNDPVRSVLEWLDDPENFRERTGEARWDAFVRQSQSEFGFDPSTEGALSAARRLGTREDRWTKVWTRFFETPERYPGVVEQLRRARPEEFIVDHVDSWPQDSEAAEDHLRSKLHELDGLTAEKARSAILALDADHGPRRATVWAELNLTPLAFALEHLTVLAEVTRWPLAASNLEDLARDYVDRGWKADDAVVRALDSAPQGADRTAVSAAVSAIYNEWLDLGSEAMQSAVGPMVNANPYEVGAPATKAPGTAILFVDGLRFDIARRVEERLVDSGLQLRLSTTNAALPTVTQTAKPALMPVPGSALGPGPDLHAVNATSGTRASIQVLRTLLAENEVQILKATEFGDPSGAAWTEIGEIDHRGHEFGERIVEFLDEEVSRIVGRILELLEFGWEQVELVTDHGWLLVPGGMPKQELSSGTAEIRKGRCARLKAGAVVGVPTVPWFWDEDVTIALAPGASCFEANKEFEHGGISPQECIVPRAVVTAGGQAATKGPEITKVKWLGLQCRVEFTGVTDKIEVDLRGMPAEPASSIAERAKETTRAGRVSLVVPDEELEGEPVYLVLTSSSGQILAQRELVVGSNK